MCSVTIVNSNREQQNSSNCIVTQLSVRSALVKGAWRINNITQPKILALGIYLTRL